MRVVIMVIIPLAMLILVVAVMAVLLALLLAVAAVVVVLIARHDEKPQSPIDLFADNSLEEKKNRGQNSLDQ